jgi:hypothetical protein
MKEIVAKADSLAANRYPPSLFSFFSDSARIAEIQTYAKKNLPPGSASDNAVAQAVDEIGFRSEFKQRLVSQLTASIGKNQPAPATLAPKKSGKPKRKR